MIRSLEDVVERLKKLPESRQAYVAEVLEQIIETSGDVFVIPEDHLEGVLQGLAEAESGELVGDDEMAALWTKCGL